MSNNIAIVGGIPEPVGGVTTFIRRLVRVENSVTHIFDLYPSSNKNLPSEYKGKYYCSFFKGFTLMLFLFFSGGRVFDVVHFNFSTPRALIFLFFLPKFKRKWILTLHHGELVFDWPGWFLAVVSKKIDIFNALNENQKKKFGEVFKEKKIILMSSYVSPREEIPSDYVVDLMESKRSLYNGIFVCSGYPKGIYRHLEAIDFISKRQNDLLICFIYGDGELKDEIVRCSSIYGNVIVLENTAEKDFNYVLEQSNYYLRLNTEDSFGIAVADAVCFGVKVISTDVCSRYPGAILISSNDSLDVIEYIVDCLEKGNDASLRKSKFNIVEFNYDKIMSLI